MWAAGNGNLKAVELLLAKGADVNTVTSEKFESVKNGPIAFGNLSALMLAAPYGGPEVVKTLLDAGAKVNAMDVRNMTPLMMAVATDHGLPRANEGPKTASTPVPIPPPRVTSHTFTVPSKLPAASRRPSGL